MSNDKVIKSTVQQLAPQDAARLLTVAVQRLQSSPKRGKQISAWVRALLLFHTAYLISAPGTLLDALCQHGFELLCTSHWFNALILRVHISAC